MDMEKKCFKCRNLKPLDEFYRHKKMADGHLNKCKDCAKKDVRRRYYDPESRPLVKAYELRRSQDPYRKANTLEYQKNRRKNAPQKVRARAAVNNALRRGKMARGPCEVCGERAQGHHTDYARPLDVTWLCFRHHREAHGQQID